MWRIRWMLAASWIGAAAVSCGGNNQSNYVKAAVGTGALLAATGVNRAVTKSCWGNCSRGYACNEKTGLCELGECLPGCAVGTHCVRDARDITYCARDSTPPASPKATPATSPSPASPSATSPSAPPPPL
jgi:hypothetical protein